MSTICYYVSVQWSTYQVTLTALMLGIRCIQGDKNTVTLLSHVFIYMNDQTQGWRNRGTFCEKVLGNEVLNTAGQLKLSLGLALVLCVKVGVYMS